MAQKCPSCDYPYVPNGSKVNCPNCGNEIKAAGIKDVLAFIIIIVALLYFFVSPSSSESASKSTNANNLQTQESGIIKDEANSNLGEDKIESPNQNENLELKESQTESVDSRDPREKDVANVLFNPRYSLFDLLTDEIILPNQDGFYNIYYSSNEDPTPKKFSGNAIELSNLRFYKFANFENCKTWCDNKTVK